MRDEYLIGNPWCPKCVCYHPSGFDCEAARKRAVTILPTPTTPPVTLSEARLLLLALTARIAEVEAERARIAQIIESVDQRCMAHEGPVARTLDEMTQKEISAIYALAMGKPETWTPDDDRREFRFPDGHTIRGKSHV